MLAGEESPVLARKRKPGSIEVKSHLFISPGIELQISPEEAGMSPDQIRALVRELMNASKKVLKNMGES